MQPNTPEPNERMRRMQERISKSAEAIKQEATPSEQPPAPTPMQTVPIEPAPPPAKPDPAVVADPPKDQDMPPELPLLYQSEYSAEFMMRPFDRRRDKSAISSDPYTAGAMDALVILTRKKRYELYDEMVEWCLEHYGEFLEARPDVVRRCEQPYRDKHRI